VALVKGSLIVLLFVGVLSLGTLSLSFGAEPTVSDARTSYAIESDGSMTVEAYRYHDVDYLLVEGGDGETARLEGIGETASMSQGAGAVNVYMVVDGQREYIQSHEFHEPPA
jgi:hypothetical protein